MKIKFKYWLHDDYTRGEFREEILENNIGLHSDPDEKDDPLYVEDMEALMEKIGRPFYEVTLECELDTETGEVTVLKTTL